MEVLLFGLIAEKAGTTKMWLDVPTVDALRRSLAEQIPGFAGLSYAIAVDRRIVTGDRALSGKEQVAVLPPFAGG